MNSKLLGRKSLHLYKSEAEPIFLKSCPIFAPFLAIGPGGVVFPSTFFFSFLENENYFHPF